MSKRKKQKSRSDSAPAPAAESVRVVAKPKTNAVPRSAARPDNALVFGRDTYLWLGGGFLLIVIGFLLMTGGRGDDPTVFDESVIYSWRKITLAPIIILSGLGVVTYAIFKK
ncbi:hypothetical protein GGR26_000994 [Lewinella marina]|uniref:DUF3098 domain-containing protein n=1 Tax=Neolewinella marina TaxID=438751 RepID=A0A2G0CI73_9BACT|nr:DUF3098 domain-containing protein [Neolewinella marina]NJB85249.1 hypothetical protein [Neolewinella marina]PHK99620.1 hypothetical protein CGL56_00800 [Neolewinella marina]